MTVRYRFVGEGAGVPGLPHEIESKSGLPEHLQPVLDAALENGTYERVSSGATHRSDATSLSSDDDDDEEGD